MWRIIIKVIIVKEKCRLKIIFVEILFESK